MRATLLLVVLLAGRPVCNIPVFRYALERWPAAPYPAVVFHRGDSPRVSLEDGALNVAVEIVDVGRPMSDEHRRLWDRLQAPSLPWLALRFPGGEGAIAWSGPYAEGSLRALADSPARRELVSRLLRGASAVWLLVESGNAGLDAAASALLAAELPKLEKSLPIAKPAPGDPPLRLDLPLAVAFSVLRVSASDPAESAFVETLRRGWPELSLPAVFPVFGRGRTLGALHGEELQAAAVKELATYVTAPCSCEIKEFNPGMDLLVSAAWEQLLDLGPAPPEPAPLPPVVIPPGQKADVPAAPPARPAFVGGVAAAALGALAVLAVFLLRARK
jgi:hypothetical protein